MNISQCLKHPFGRRTAGFTLAEVLVAVAIMAISFVSLYAGIFYCFGVTTFEREDLRATQVMLQRMEGIRLFNWYQVADTNLNPTTFTERYYPATGGSPASGATYSGEVEIVPVTEAEVPATYRDRMRKVTVTVRWTAGKVLRTRSISTYVAKDGIQNYVYNY